MSAATVPSSPVTALAQTGVQPPGGFMPVAWIPDRDLDLKEWGRVGQRLGLMGRCNQWWLGDWIRYGNAKYGEKYSRAAKLTGYDAHTLKNMVWVANQFHAIARRRETLSWSHHEAVASLEPAQQEHWLTVAAGLSWSVTDLRSELRTQRNGAGSTSSKDATDGGQSPGEERLGDSDQAQAPEEMRCPRCGQRIPRELFTT